MRQYFSFVFKLYISLPSKSKLKQYQQLHSKKFRQKYGLFLVEGLKSVNELAASDWPLETILCTPAFLERYGDKMEFEFDLISSEEFALTSHLANPQEILAIAQIVERDTPVSDWQIALDGINDPGNLGTIIRIADWYGINTIYCSSNTVDFYNSKVIQSTMGSFLRVNGNGNTESLNAAMATAICCERLIG